MSLLDVKEYPDIFLKNETEPLEKIDDSIKTLVNDMADTMYHFDGVGLAAIQVGVNKSIVVYDDSAKEERGKHLFKVIINPHIIEQKGSKISKAEGCLSVPDFRSDVRRAEFVRVKGADINGEPLDIKAEGLLSNILQHEIDHLNGVLFIDRISALKRNMYKRKMMKKHKKEKE